MRLDVPEFPRWLFLKWKSWVLGHPVSSSLSITTRASNRWLVDFFRECPKRKTNIRHLRRWLFTTRFDARASRWSSMLNAAIIRIFWKLCVSHRRGNCTKTGKQIPSRSLHIRSTDSYLPIYLLVQFFCIIDFNVLCKQMCCSTGKHWLYFHWIYRPNISWCDVKSEVHTHTYNK